MRYQIAALAAAAALLATAAAARAPDGGTSGFVAGRQAGMRMSGTIMGGIKAALDRGDDVKTLGFPARSIESWAKAIPGMFPEGSGGAPSEAAPTVWSDRAGFEAQAGAYAAAAGKMADAAKAGDANAFAAAFGEARASCGGCHMKYKLPDQH